MISQKTKETSQSSTPPKVPRLESLLHRLQHAKDAQDQPIPLLDELLFFLDDPPHGTGDRWQKGADLCQSHGIETSRMSVWRLYRSHILQWRREQNPAPPEPAPSPEEIDRLRDHTRHLAVQRMLETLNDPQLSPGHLIGLIQNDNQSQQIQLARDQFNDRVAVRRHLERKQHLQRIDDQIRDERLLPSQMQYLQKLISTLLAVPPDNTP